MVHDVNNHTYKAISMRGLHHEPQVSSLLMSFSLINFSDLITIIRGDRSFQLGQIVAKFLMVSKPIFH